MLPLRIGKARGIAFTAITSLGDSMRKEILSLIVGVGLVYAQAVVAKDKDMNRNDSGRTSQKLASNYDSKQLAKKNYYKHEKKNTQRVTQDPSDAYSADDRAYIGPKPTATSTRQNQKYINNVESDLDQLRDHR